MGFNIEISLDKDIRQIKGFFDDLKFKAVTTAARQGINKAGASIVSLGKKEFRKNKNLKLKDLKRKIFFRRAKGSNIAKLEGIVKFSGVPLPMILFIVGTKKPKIQTASNTKRKSRKFQLKKGVKTARPGLFVQKASRGREQFRVFRRVDPNDKSKGFKVQSVPSVAAFLRKKFNVMRRIENSAIALLQKEYDRALAFQLSKLKL